MLFCCHMMLAPLPEALLPLNYSGAQPPSTDAILSRLQVPTMLHHLTPVLREQVLPFAPCLCILQKQCMI